MKIGAYHHAITIFERSLRVQPDYAPTWLLLGNSYKVLKQFNDAIECYKNAMKIDPSSVKYKKNIADVYLVMGNHALYKEGKYQDAIQHFDVVLKMIPNQISALYAKGIAYKKLGAYRNATACFLKVVEIDPNNAHAYYEMGIIMEKTGNLDESRRCFYEAIRSDPSHTDAMYRLGNILLEGGDYLNAITYFDKIIERKPD